MKNTLNSSLTHLFFAKNMQSKQKMMQASAEILTPAVMKVVALITLIFFWSFQTIVFIIIREKSSADANPMQCQYR